MRTKLVDLRQTIACSANSYDIIILVETWLNDGFFDSEIGLDNYKIYRCDRSKSSNAFSRGGGGLDSRKEYIAKYKNRYYERIVNEYLVIHYGSRSVLFGAVYLPPSSVTNLAVLRT